VIGTVVPVSQLHLANIGNTYELTYMYIGALERRSAYQYDDISSIYHQESGEKRYKTEDYLLLQPIANLPIACQFANCQLPAVPGIIPGAVVRYQVQ